MVVLFFYLALFIICLILVVLFPSNIVIVVYLTVVLFDTILFCIEVDVVHVCQFGANRVFTFFVADSAAVKLI